MNSSPLRSSLGASRLLLAVVLSLLGSCRGQPVVLAVMKHPVTGQEVEMYRESRLKVPAHYNEAKHIEQWKAEQREKGFTVEVRRSRRSR